MLTIKEIQEAITELKTNEYKTPRGTSQLAQSLSVYWSRKEFDGSIDSAVECLLWAGYEIQQREAQHETK